MKNSTFKICNESIYPGEKLSLALPLPQLFSCAPLFMPLKVIHGKKSGPCLLVTATMYGNEVNGTEIINRLLRLPISQLHGTLIAVPVLNVYGLINRTRYLPGGIDLDQCFPGAEHGSHSARLAHIFLNEVFSKANYCIDLQTGLLNLSNLPHLYVNFKDPVSKNLSEIFNAPVILNAKEKKNSLREFATKQGVPFLTYEAGEAMRFDENAIRVGLTGITNIMRKISMLPEKLTRTENNFQSFFAKENLWIRASSSGISHSKIKLGQYVKRNDPLSMITDPFGATEDTIVRSQHDGIIIGKNNLPLVHEGERLFQLAIFSEMQEAASQLYDWHESCNETLETID